MRNELLASAKRVQSSMADLFKTLQDASADPTNYIYQSQLLEAAREQIPFYSQLCSTTRKATTSIVDLNKKQFINSSSQETTDTLGLLMRAIQEVSDNTGETAIEDAIAEFDSSKNDLTTAHFFADSGMLQKTPGQTRDSAQALYNISIDSVKKSLDKLTIASKHCPKLPEAIMQAAGSIGQLVNASQSQASTLTDRKAQKSILTTASQLLDSTLEAIAQARVLAIDPTNKEKENNFNKAKAKVLESLGNVDDVVKIDTKPVTDAVQAIEKEKAAVNSNATKKMTFKEAAEDLSSKNKAVVATITQLTNVAKSNPTGLPLVAKMTANATCQFLQMASVAATAAVPDEITEQICLQARLLASAMQDLLNSTVDVAQKKTPENIKVHFILHN